jgi:esterase/lipase superfamily enzyme
MLIALLFTLLALADDHPLRERYERQADRCEDKLVLAEGRWVRLCEVDDADPKTERRLQRAVAKLVGRRARHARAQARLEALGAPEVLVQVAFATNRVPDDQQLFGARDQGRTSYGLATVRIPADHPAGALERDLQIVSVQPLSQVAFHQHLAIASGVDQGLLVFVHGYNNSFPYAVRRLAQVSHDLQLPVVPVLFSWPSHGGTALSMAKYTYDENAAARSSAAFADLLGDLLSQQRAPVALMAHSMGSRVVSEGLVDLQRTARDVRRLDEIVLAAPDIDATVFEQRYADVALASADRVTLYCADDDRALKLSRRVHGGYDRLGSCRESSLQSLARPGLEVVDASMLYVDLIDHDKVASSPRLLDDLRQVFVGAPVSADERGLRDAGVRFELPP